MINKDQTIEIRFRHNKINLSQLLKGVYLISIFNKDYRQTDRIILE